MQNNYKVICMAGRQVVGSGFAWCCLYHLKKAETTLGSLEPDRNPWGLRPSSRKITSGVLRLAVNVGLRTYFREMSLIFATYLWGKK